MEGDKCSDDDFEVVTGTSPRPRSVTPDPPHPFTRESFVNLGASLLRRRGSKVYSPSGSILSSPSATTVPLDSGDEEIYSDTSSRRWSAKLSLSRSFAFIIFFAVTAGIAILCKQLQIHKTERMVQLKENQKLSLDLHARDAQIVALVGKISNFIGELDDKEAQRLTLVEEMQGLVKELAVNEAQRVTIAKERLDLVMELDDKEFEMTILSNKAQMLELEVLTYKSQESDLLEMNRKLTDTLADAMEALSGCQSDCSTVQPSMWARMRNSVSWLLPDCIKRGVAWLTPDWLKDALSWLRDQGIKLVGYVTSIYVEPERLGM